MRKSLTTLSLILLLLISMTSCKTNFYQVYTVETEGAEQVDNSLVFENNDCKVYYNLWSNNGKLSFVFLNKTDKDIFINLGQTFFIKKWFCNRLLSRAYIYRSNLCTNIIINKFW